MHKKSSTSYQISRNERPFVPHELERACDERPFFAINGTKDHFTPIAASVFYFRGLPCRDQQGFVKIDGEIEAQLC